MGNVFSTLVEYTEKAAEFVEDTCDFIAENAVSVGLVVVGTAGMIASAAITAPLGVSLGLYAAGNACVVGGITYYIHKPNSTPELGKAYTNYHEIERRRREEEERRRREMEERRRREEEERRRREEERRRREMEEKINKTDKRIQELSDRVDGMTGKNSVLGKLGAMESEWLEEKKKIYEDSNNKIQALNAMEKIMKEMKDLKSKSLKKEDVFKLMRENAEFNEAIISTTKQVIKEIGADSPYFTKFMDQLKTLKTTQNKLAGEFLDILEEVAPKEFKQLKDTKPRLHKKCCDNHHYECGGIYCQCAHCSFLYK